MDLKRSGNLRDALELLSVGRRRQSYAALEDPPKRGRVTIPDRSADLVDRQSVSLQHLLGFLDSQCLHVFQRRKARCRLETRSEEHTSELQSLMRISYDVFCLKTK